MPVYYLAVFCGEAQSGAVTLAMARWMEPCLAINHSLVNPRASEYKVTSASRESATQGSTRFGRLVWPWARCLHLGAVLHVVNVPCVLLHVPLNQAATTPKQRHAWDLFFLGRWVGCFFFSLLRLSRFYQADDLPAKFSVNSTSNLLRLSWELQTVLENRPRSVQAWI